MTLVTPCGCSEVERLSRRFDDGYYVKSRQYTTECFDEIIGLVEYDWITT